jgi:uncharacterized protein (TIGR02145 family)
MKKILNLIILLIIFSCSTSSENNSNQDNLTDIDGNVYEFVTICNQTWTKSNLNVSKYTDGTTIPQVSDQNEWANLSTGAWCYYNNTTSNGTTYGKLYNWYAVAGIYDAVSLSNSALRKKLAPAGWHVPTDAEWTLLTDCLGGMTVAGGKMKSEGTTLWLNPNTDATNTSRFTALPGGYRTKLGMCFDIGVDSYWWSSSELNNSEAWTRGLGYASGYAYRHNNFGKKGGFSVRCVKD